MSSPITLSGFNNIDFKSIIDIIIKSEHQPIDRIQALQKTEQARLSAYSSLSTNLSSLQSAFEALESSSAYGNLKASSSDTTTLTVSATASASKGTFSINVISLGRPQVTTSAALQFNDINAAVISGGSFSITQNGTATAIDLTGVTTLAGLRDAINAQQSGIKASIINDGSTQSSPPKPFRLVLASVTPGVSNAFTVNDQTTAGGGAAGTVLNLSTDAVNGVARDTEFEYSGISIKSTSTTVSDAIPGLTLNLLKTGTSTVTVTDDDSTLKEKVTGLVNAFNKFNDFVQGQFKLPTSSSAQPQSLSNDPLLRGLNRQIRSYLTSNHANSGSIQNISALGVKLTQTGKLEIDETALDEALANNPDDVKSLLSGTDGLAAEITGYIKSYTQAGGSIATIETRIQTTINSYASRIVSLESQLALREDVLTRQFSAADEAISQLNSQANALNSLGSQYRLF